MTKCWQNIPCHLLNEPEEGEPRRGNPFWVQDTGNWIIAVITFHNVHNVQATGACVLVMNLMGFARDTVTWEWAVHDSPSPTAAGNLAH